MHTPCNHTAPIKERTPDTSTEI